MGRSLEVEFGSNQQNRSDDTGPDFRDAVPTASSVAGMIGTKNLLIVIVTMPFVFLVVVMAIISIFGRSDDAVSDVNRVVQSISPTNASLEEPAITEPQRVILPIAATADGSLRGITLPVGAETGAMSLDGDRLALRIETGEGPMIVIYDLAQNTVVQTVPILTESEQ